MPRRNRCVLAGLPCHVTQRGVDRRETFSSDQDRATYLRLLRENLHDAHASLLGWCLMSNHAHLIALPHREDSLAVLLRRVHGRYAQYYNAQSGRTGHLWQNRFFACVLGEHHLWTALAYVDRNPVRAGFGPNAADYRWSSAAAHLSGVDNTGLLDLNWWRQQERGRDWARELADDGGDPEVAVALRRCTFAGRPFASDSVVAELALRFGRSWTRGRPKKEHSAPAAPSELADQFALF